MSKLCKVSFEDGTYIILLNIVVGPTLHLELIDTDQDVLADSTSTRTKWKIRKCSLDLLVRRFARKEAIVAGLHCDVTMK